MSRSNLTIALYLLLVFGSGIAVGAFGYRVYSGQPVLANAPKKITPEEWRREYVKEMQTRCNLTSEQSQSVDGVLDDMRARFQEEHKKHDADLKSLKDLQHERITAILTPEQRPAYEKMRADREARAAANRR